MCPNFFSVAEAIAVNQTKIPNLWKADILMAIKSEKQYMYKI